MRLLAIGLTFCFSVISSCGDMESAQAPLPSIQQQRYAYKHGPPPGSPPYDYFLTTFGGPDDPGANGSMACGGQADGSWYYSTGAYTFGCKSKLKIAANNKCVVVEVADNGPAGWVEEKAQSKCGGTGYIIDASPLVGQHLFGTSSAGWSDCMAIWVTPVDGSTPTGPTDCGSPEPAPEPNPEPNPEPSPAPDSGLPTDPPPDWDPSHEGEGTGQPLRSDQFIGAACHQNSECSSGRCLSAASEGYSDGMCTQSCTRLCPDRTGSPTTFCIEQGGDGLCHSRCDTARFPGSGCRSGYRCAKLPRFREPSVKRNVCLPEDGRISLMGEPPDEEGNLPNPEAADQGHGSGATSVGCSAVPGAMPPGGALALLVVVLLPLVLRRRGGLWRWT